MEEATELDQSELNCQGSEYVDPVKSESTDPANGCGSGSAKYKLLSPAKLPISRSSCITIPPGLSPTSFLESPVLLSNMKAELSPTTGTLFKPQMSQGSIGCTPYPPTTICSAISTSNEINSSSFEFRPHASSNTVYADPNHWKSEHSMHVQGPGQSQFNPAYLVKSERAVTSNDFSTPAGPAPVSVAASGTSAPTEGDSDELNQREHSNNSLVQTAQVDHKASGASDDGYNWRKYGQKHVKGSEFPRSYYKCTHPKCEVKKLFERSHEGRITEIMYKGTHDHPKPQPSRRYNTGTIMSVHEERSDKFSSLTGHDDKPSSIYGQICNTNEPSNTPEQSPIRVNDDSLEGTGSLPNRTYDEVDDDDPFSKRRKMDFGGIDVTTVVKPIREPRVVVQTLSEVDILDDGYRWRKYGQKVVRGNPNPRSYYKCTNAGCPVRKHVERASHDPKAVITTYEGKHNHNVPTAKNSSSHDTAGPVSDSVPSRFRSDEADVISLDLGVGINYAAENRSNEHQPAVQTDSVERQTHNSNLNAIRTNPVPTYYGAWNNSLNQYGSRENMNEVGGIEIPALNHSSYPYPQNMGRVLTGP